MPADARQSITFDRGTEFSAWKHLKAGIGADAWFCDPQAPYQKGTVENTNNRLRRYLPRSTAPTALTNRYLRSICQRLNATPRKCLGYRTPAEVFESNLMEIKNREDRGPRCTLLVFVDDATSTLMQLRFVSSESTFSYFEALDLYLAAHGRPVAFYSNTCERAAYRGVTDPLRDRARNSPEKRPKTL